MNWITRMFRMCQIRFGTLSVEDLEHLCAIYIEFQNPQESSSWISLYKWKKLRRADCKRFLELYLKYHTADEGLLKSDWLLKNEHIRHAYLHGLCTREIPLTAAEEKWILNCGEPGAMRCLKFPLSANGEYKLLKSEDYKMIENYLICHLLRENGEAQLAMYASDKEYPNRAEAYRRLLRRYFEIQHRAEQHKVFTGFMAQWCLFADERNEEFIMEVLQQCDMDDCVLENAIIRRMAWGMSPEYLTWYLSYSYISDKDLTTELLQKGLSGHLQDMVAVSEQRRTIHQIMEKSWLFSADGWHDDELEAYNTFCREDNAKKRMADLKAFLEPRFKEGKISPAMSAWVAARCPELAKEAQINLTRYKKRLLDRVTLINPLSTERYSCNYLL